MAEAIVRGILKAERLRPDQIVAADVAPERRAFFTENLGVATTDSGAQAVVGARRVMLAVKPQMMKAALEQIASGLSTDVLLISIAAGISTGFIERNIGRGIHWRVVRTMPNTPMLVGSGMVGIAKGAHATPEDVADTRRLFESAGAVVEVEEDKLHAVTALSGSGPAYFFFLVEQMVRAGVELGLTAEQAQQLATRTALGSALMMADESATPETLRQKVTSPNGTTHAAISYMEQAELPRIIVEALKAADRRSRELGV